MSFSIRINGKPFAAVGKTLATSGEVITNTMISRNVLTIYYQSMVSWLCKELNQIGNVWENIVQQIRMNAHCNNNMCNMIKKDEADS